MNKNAIKKFAIDARNKLIASVTDKAGMLGITANGISDAITKGRDFEVYKTSAGTEVTLNRTQSEQRRRLVAQIEARGFEAVIEEVAYTWFNRICAIRFMEVNDYLSVRVLSSVKDGKTEPDIVTNAPDVDIDFTDAEKSFILEAKVGNKLDELFRMLFIKQCHELNDILPELFEKTEDYTEMLLNISYTNEDDVIRMLVDTVDEKDFNVTTLGEDGKPTGQVEIIGWLYQYYNTELKDDTFAKLKKNVKITKERIPAATQLFTPDWIVRYMVENSVGRIWIEHLRAVDPSVDEKITAENFGWKYYLPEAEQEESVNVKLAEIRTSYANLKPEDITCIDPCMGSGHILIAMFDVLMDIYKSTGYSEKEAAFSIVENNIHGLDIDKRAYQLAYFAVMMKGRGYNRRFFRGHDDMKPQPKVYAIQESNGINRAHIKYFGAGLNAIEKNNALNQINGLLDVMADAREYGSILSVDNYDWDLLRRFAAESGEENQLNLETIGIDGTQRELLILIQVGETMARKYFAVITNPPYMVLSNAGAKLNNYVKKYFPDSKADLFAVFIQKCGEMLRKEGFQSMITQHSWMFLTSFEALREELLRKTFINMIHLGARAFDEIGGEVVQTTSFTIKKACIDDYRSTYSRLIHGNSETEKKDLFIRGEHFYVFDQKDFEKIPGSPIAYWISKKLANAFVEGKGLEVYGLARAGLSTGNNDKYMRLWFEPDIHDIGFTFENNDQYKSSGVTYVPCNKGGSYRRWYGNNDYVIDWRNPEEFHRPRTTYMDLYYREAVTWSVITSGDFSGRYYGKGFLFDHAAASYFVNKPEDQYSILAFLNSKVAQLVLTVINPTLNTGADVVMKFPLVDEIFSNDELKEIAKENIRLCKEDWDSFETSWEFKKHPLLNGSNRISEAYANWKSLAESRYSAVMANEKRLNEIIIAVYGLRDELDAAPKEESISIRKADLKRDIRSLISYAVGCMFGRYSLDQIGVCCAGNLYEDKNYIAFSPDKDNIIPVTDEEYFEDDIVGRFAEWLKIAFGTEFFEENLDFIASNIGVKGVSSRDILRKYFLNEFYKDHCSMYSVGGSGKRPIYWLFDTGKESGFKCLIYAHRYYPDIVGRIRTDYLHVTQKAIEQAMESAERIGIASASNADKAEATKRIAKYAKQLAEIQVYDEAMAHIANERIAVQLSDGIKQNYSLFQGVEVTKEGKKSTKINLLSDIK